jgi:ribosomal protein S18 acetylase RimI-like enzyme
VIRRATREDVDAIARLYDRTFRTQTYLPVLHTPDEHRAWFAAQLRDHEGWVWDDGEIAGFIVLTEHELLYIYLDVSRTGQGIGTALLEHAKRRRPGGFTLWTFQENEGARRFYERHGLRAIEFGDGSGNEEGVPDVRYEWRPPDPGV